jgi:3-phenylpropionate/trans-cinnamate dioxygenase ferredoxin reductase subunit
MAASGLAIVGAGHAGGRAALALRAAGYDGPLALIGAEPDPPYERPPLSKGLLTGAQAPASCLLQPAERYAALGIELRLGTPVAAIERAERRLRLADGTALAYDRLLLAPGGSPRRLDLPGAELDSVLVLRDLADAAKLAGELRPGRRLAVIGGGFIGLEVAASARAQGVEVVVLEQAPGLMRRCVPAEIGDRMAARHRAGGIELRYGAALAGFVGQRRLEAVRLGDGRLLPCDLALIGIGIRPRTALAAAAGLEIADGIVVDGQLRTSDPAIFAIGDAVVFPHPLFGRRLRLEAWKNAEDQAAFVAEAMLGRASSPFAAVPWFWSDQHDLPLQVAGLPDLGATTIRREMGEDGLLCCHLDATGRLVGASAIGPGTSISRDVRVCQLLIERAASPDPAALADPATRLRGLLR